MSYINRILAVFFVILNFQTIHAHNGFELGAGVGSTNPFAGNNFNDVTGSGDANSYWLGYYLQNNLSLNLNFDSYDFDKTNISGQMLSVGATYQFVHNEWIHPLAKIALGSASTKNNISDKYTGLGGKLAFGLEADFKYLSIGALFNWIYNDKVVGSTTGSSQIENAQAIVPMLTLTVHSPFEDEVKTAATPTKAAPVIIAKDSDGDGITDEDDKCPNTPARVKTNSIGCSETEKASVKLQLEFAGGKSEIAAKYQPEILKLAEFMKKFTETKVEIAGHTDSKGNAARNTKLSQARAEAVKRDLVQVGINADRITAKGYGSTQPVATNDTPEGRANNRRVVAEISIETEVKK